MKPRFTAVLLTLSIGLSSVFSTVTAEPLNQYAAAAMTAGFKDSTNHWGASAISWGVQNGVVNGYADGTFRPDNSVSEPEFLAMLLRAYPEVKLTNAAAGTPWYKPYYDMADSRKWPLVHNTDAAKFNRGQVALIVASAQKGAISMNDSISYLLENGLSQGKTAATLAGYQAADRLSRAEAVQFIRNVKQKQYALLPSSGAVLPSNQAISAAGFSDLPQNQEVKTEPASAVANAVTLKGIRIGDSEKAVITRLGQPARKDLSEYGFDWYIYNQDYASYAQVGIRDGKVVGLYSPSDTWEINGIADGSAKTDVINQFGQPLPSILKGNTRFVINYGKSEYGTYESDGAYISFFYDLHRNNVVTGVQVIAKPVELAMASFYPAGSSALIASYERQIFDLANAARVKLGKSVLTWDETISGTGRKHSQDMAANNYFAHESLNGASPFDRMKADGLKLRAASENIAAGQTSAIFAHQSWMNSEGHRKNLLSDIQRLGTGVAFGGKMSIYYAQEFYTPQ
jgi:uncharacterized protein YkwD